MSLASYLQAASPEAVPPGWTCASEVAVLPDELERVLGFAPRADVLLENRALNRRVWVEFEVSRVDPAANHVKFAAGHLFMPQTPSDAFVSMVSGHVTPGRMNLAACAVLAIRRLGMQAFQVPLFPGLPGARIKSLNHGTRSDLVAAHLDVRAEVERALAIVEPAAILGQHRIHFAGNPLEVSLNVIGWNGEVRSPVGAALWGRRTLTISSSTRAPACSHRRSSPPSSPPRGPGRRQTARACRGD